MSDIPRAGQIEVPILQELRATGGAESPRHLQERLLSYFPRLSAQLGLPEPPSPNFSGADLATLRQRFHRTVLRAGAQLSARGELQRARDRWQLTDKGQRRAAAEDLGEAPLLDPPGTPPPLDHVGLQTLLVDLGRLLGRHAQVEHEFYDVVWRESPRAPRLSHVFEVQVAGSVDGALTRLCRAHEAQRSQLFLVVADERSARFAAERLRTAFPDLAPRVNIIGSGELARLYQSLRGHGDLLPRLLARG